MTVVPLAVLLWLGWKLTQQDDAIDAQQRRDRLQLAAERVVSVIERAVSTSEQAVAAGRVEWANGAVAVTFHGDRVDLAPSGRVAYMPVVPPARVVPDAVFRDAEVLEFQRQDRRAAVAAYRRLSLSADAAVRAGALLRLGRNLNALGDTDAALEAYAALTQIDDVLEASVPVSLAAAWGRCVVLEKHRRDVELRVEARNLYEAMRAGRWRVTEAVYLTYVADAARWSGANESAAPAELLAAAISRIWTAHVPTRGLQNSGPTRQSITVANQPVIILWQQSNAPRALFALSSFVESEWLRTAASLAANHDIEFTSSAAAATFARSSLSQTPAALTISSAQSNLPWTTTFNLSAVGPDEGLVARRRLLVAGFGLLVALSIAASWLILRAVGREMAVARLQSDFVAAVSHEFRTPLTTLRQFTEMLRSRSGLSDERRHACYDAQARATERLTRLVESVLDFGRMEAGARPYSLARVDCAAIVERVVAEFRESPAATGRHVSLSRNGSMLIDADEEALSRAVWNLLDNAAKYSPDGSEIRVDLDSRDGDALVAVQDRGFGIPPAEQQRLFRKFQRGEEARRLGIKGTGIGLAMVHHIVRAHQGTVNVRSQLHAGSTFTIVLPLRG